MLADIAGWKIHRGPKGDGCPYNTRYSTLIKIFIKISNKDKVIPIMHIHAIYKAHFFATIQLQTVMS